jgi:hypothetical protein
VAIRVLKQSSLPSRQSDCPSLTEENEGSEGFSKANYTLESSALLRGDLRIGAIGVNRALI